jgi:putative endonuclease
MFWTYILQNPAGKFYIGHTEDLQIRVTNHNRTDKTAGKFTRKNGPWVLVWSEGHPNRSNAMRRERQIKSWKSSVRIRSVLLDKPAQCRVPTESGLTDWS